MRSTTSLIAILLLGLTSCQRVEHEAGLCAAPDRDFILKPASKGTHYFPATFGKATRLCGGHCNPIINSVTDRWYPEQWDAAGEPSLFELSQQRGALDTKTIRFTWLPSFDHQIFVRFTIRGVAATMIATELSGAGGYEPGKISRQVRRDLSPGERQRLASVLARTAVLDLPADDCDMGADGSEWIAESADARDYRFVDRWSPVSGPMHEFGLFALELTGWHPTIY